MIARIFVTLIVLLLAVYAFVGNALGAGHYFNPFGILCLFLTALIWFAWEPFRDAFLEAKNESTLPIIRLAAKIIAGMGDVARTSQRHRTPPSD